MKPLVATVARNSRTATCRIFFIASPPTRRRRAAPRASRAPSSSAAGGASGDDLDEDVLERRPVQLDPRRGHRCRRAPDRRRRVGRRRQRDLVRPPVPAHGLDARHRLAAVRRRPPGRAARTGCSLRVERLADAGQRLVEHLLAVVDHHDVVADLLRLDHDVGREDDRGAAPVLLEHEVAQQPHVDRVETAERLVEDQQIGLVDHRGDELDLLLHALGQLLALLVLDLAETDPLEPLPHPPAQVAARRPPFSRAM